MPFNPNEHMMNLKGKDYLQVAWRLVWFREDHPDWSINADALALADDHAIFKATISDAEGKPVSTGHGSESKKDFGDFIEKAETKAIGRALAMLGYGTQFAADELDEGSRIVDTPIKRKPDKPEPEDTLQPGEKIKVPDWDPRKTLSKWCQGVGMTMEEFGKIRKQLIDQELVPEIPSGELTLEDFDFLCKTILKHWDKK